MSAAATPLLYLLPAAAIVGSLYVIRRSAKPRPGPSRFERVTDAIKDIVLALWKRRPAQAVPAGGRG